MTERSVTTSSLSTSSAGLFTAAALFLAAFHLFVVFELGGYGLDLGSLNIPTPRYLALVRMWMPLGTLAAGFLALGIERRSSIPGPLARLIAAVIEIPERQFLILTCVAAFAIPLGIRLCVLQGAPLTDDETAYRFAAELLASGRLWVSSPELKHFFDHGFMINDGRLYPVYFLGWPALLAPGVWIGAPGIMNPFYSALTVPPLVWVIGHVVGRPWGRAGAFLFLSSPFLQIAAATQLSHTSCLAALTWCLWMYVRATDPNASLRDHIGFALSFSLAFCIRPHSALPIGLPLIVSWAMSVARLTDPQRIRAVGAFLISSTAMATLFLGTLWAQNGSPWLPGYARYHQYIVDTDFRFPWSDAVLTNAVPGFDFSHLVPALIKTASGIFRLNFDLFGWPTSLCLLWFALPVAVSRSRIFWAMFASYFLFFLFQNDWGIDTFGPVHAFEVSLPVVVLTIMGVRNLGQRMNRKRGDGSLSATLQKSAFAPALLSALAVTAWLGFVPIRLQAVRQIAAHLNVALRAAERAGIDRAVIFAPFPFAPPCHSVPRHFVFFRPVSDPFLTNDILWVNHITVEDDRRLVTSLGDRPGFIMQWTDACKVTLQPLGNSTVGGVFP